MRLRLKVRINILALFFDQLLYVPREDLSLVLLCEPDAVQLFVLRVNFFPELLGEVDELLVVLFEIGKLPLLSDLVVLEPLDLLAHQRGALGVHARLQGQVVQVLMVTLRVELRLHLLHELLEFGVAYETVLGRPELLRDSVLQRSQLLFELFRVLRTLLARLLVQLGHVLVDRGNPLFHVFELVVVLLLHLGDQRIELDHLRLDFADAALGLLLEQLADHLQRFARLLLGRLEAHLEVGLDLLEFFVEIFLGQVVELRGLVFAR